MKVLFIFLFTSICLVSANNVNITLHGPELPFGYWSPFEMCKNGSYAIGFRIKMNTPGSNVLDNEALNGIELVCANSTSVTNTPHSGERKKGWFNKSKWGDYHYCKKGDYLTGFSLKQQDKQGFFHDDLGAVNIQFECSDNTILKENVTYHQGYWHKWGRCPDGGAICGISTKIDNSIFDSAGLVSANFLCCPKPSMKLMPSARTLPKDVEVDNEIVTSTPSPEHQSTTPQPQIHSIELSKSIPTIEHNITEQIPIHNHNTTDKTNATLIRIPLHKNSMTFDLINSLLQLHLKKLNGTISELEHRLNETKKKSEDDKNPIVTTIIRRNEHHPNGSHITFRRIIISRTPIFTIIKNEGPTGESSPIYVPHKIPGQVPYETSTSSPIPVYTVKDGKVIRFTVNVTQPNASEPNALHPESRKEMYNNYFGLNIFFHILAILCACIFFFLFGFLCKKLYVLKFKNKKDKEAQNPVTLQKDVEKGDTVKIPEKIQKY